MALFAVKVRRISPRDCPNGKSWLPFERRVGCAFRARLERAPIKDFGCFRKTDAFPAFYEDLLGLAVYEPNETAEHQGVVELHWRFDELKEAESVAEALSALS